MAFKDFSKKIVDNITKGLLQNYQNFTSQNQSSWVMGRLNGDGTATLPDGSTVKVITRGIAGTYVRLFNMGNGTWLADVPSSGHVQADGGEILKGWFITPILKETTPIPDLRPPPGFLDDLEKIKYINTLVNTLKGSFEVDKYYISNVFTGQKVEIPDAFFSGMRVPSFEYSLTPIVVPFTGTSFNLQAQGSISSNQPYFERLDSPAFSLQFYSSIPGGAGIVFQKPQIIFSLDGKHLIVYSMSNIYDQRHGQVTETFIESELTTTWNVNIGEDLFLQYRVYKDLGVNFDTGEITWSGIEENTVNFSPTDFPLQQSYLRTIGAGTETGTFNGASLSLSPQIIAYSNQSSELIVDLMYSVTRFENVVNYGGGIRSANEQWSSALYLFKDVGREGKNNKLTLNRYLSSPTFYVSRDLESPAGEFIDGLAPNLINGEIFYSAVKGPVKDEALGTGLTAISLYPTSVLLLDDSWNIIKTLNINPSTTFREVLDNELLFNADQVIVGQQVSAFLESLGYSEGGVNFPTISVYTFFNYLSFNVDLFDSFYLTYGGARTARNYATYTSISTFSPESLFYYAGTINRLAQTNLGNPLPNNRWLIPARIGSDYKVVLVAYDPDSGELTRNREISTVLDSDLVFLNPNPSSLPQGAIYAARAGLQAFNTTVRNPNVVFFPFEGAIRVPVVNDMYIGPR